MPVVKPYSELPSALICKDLHVNVRIVCFLFCFYYIIIRFWVRKKRGRICSENNIAFLVALHIGQNCHMWLPLLRQRNGPSQVTSMMDTAMANSTVKL